MKMRELIEGSSGIWNSKQTIGAFGGDRYWWPTVPENWAVNDWDTAAGDDVITQTYQYENHGALFLKIDASGWLKTEGKSPVKVEVKLLNKVVKSIDIPDLTTESFVKAFSIAEKLQDEMAAKVKRAMPDIAGWEKTWLGYDDFEYSRDIKGVHVRNGYPAEAQVRFELPEYVLLANGKADASVNIPYAGYYEYKWGSASDVKSIIRKVDEKANAVEKKHGLRKDEGITVKMRELIEEGTEPKPDTKGQIGLIGLCPYTGKLNLSDIQKKNLPVEIGQLMRAANALKNKGLIKLQIMDGEGWIVSLTEKGKLAKEEMEE